LLHRKAAETDREAESRRPRWLRVLTGRRLEGVGVRKPLRVFYVVVVTGAFPASVIGLVSDPVVVISTSGTVATVHTPFLVVLICLANRRLRESFRPTIVWSASMVAAAFFYGGFLVHYFLDGGGLLSHWAS